MEKTDRQTDKASCWSVTAYNEEIAILEDKAVYPDFVKEVLGGKEECPTTGKVHFQGCVLLRSQQRLSALKKWLPTAHWEIARSREALKRYAMKEDTAIGEKVVRENAVPYLQLDDKLMLLVEALDDLQKSEMDDYARAMVEDPNDGEFWWLLTNKVLPKHGRKIINAFAYPEVRKLWKHTRSFWVRQGKPPLSITEAADTIECV